MSPSLLWGADLGLKLVSYDQPYALSDIHSDRVITFCI